MTARPARGQDFRAGAARRTQKIRVSLREPASKKNGRAARDDRVPGRISMPRAYGLRVAVLCFLL